MVSGLAALAVTGMVLEIDPGANFVHWMIGHAVGLLTFLPFTISLSYAVHNGQPVLPDNRRLVAVLAVVAMTVLTAVVFSQPNRPLMLFPVLMVVAAAVWAPCVVTTFLPCVLALIGGMLTMRGEGPVAMMHLDLGDRMQFFEIYIAVTVLFALPVQFEQERRRRQMRELAESEARIACCPITSATSSCISMPMASSAMSRPRSSTSAAMIPRVLSARMSRN
jgi:integral membrane sensor domain MASE1